jgi:hypothetical protein
MTEKEIFYWCECHGLLKRQINCPAQEDIGWIEYSV